MEHPACWKTTTTSTRYSLSRTDLLLLLSIPVKGSLLSFLPSRITRICARLYLATLCQTSETARTLYSLVQEFRHMLHLSFGALLDDWLEKVRTSQISALQRFVA